MAGEQQVEQRDKHQYERNRVHEHSRTAQPEQARAKEQRSDNQQEVAEQQGEVSSVDSHTGIEAGERVARCQPAGVAERAQLKLDMLAPKLLCSSAEMPNVIKDEFTDLPVCRGRKYQLRMERDGRCIICGESAVGPFYCLKHWVKARERARRRIGAKKRLKGARSYRLEQEIKSARK
jgi:hypothetical protein